MGFKLDSLPPDIRAQVEAQLARDQKRRDENRAAYDAAHKNSKHRGPNPNTPRTSSPAVLFFRGPAPKDVFENVTVCDTNITNPGSKCDIKRPGRSPKKRVPNENEKAFLDYLRSKNTGMTDVKYEPCTFHTAIGNYTPDWGFYDEKRNAFVYYEVKGPHRLRSEEGARKAFLACREKYSSEHCFFHWFRSDGAGGYFEEYAEY